MTREPRGLGDRGQQRCRLPRTVVSHFVDEQGRRAVDAAAHAAQEILADARRVRARDEILAESREIEREGLGVREQAVVVQRRLVLEQQIVHRPEAVLRACRLGRFGGALGVRVHVAQWKVAIHETQLVARGAADVFDHRMRGAAVRTFEVAVFDHRHGRIHRAADVVAHVYRLRESRQLSCHACLPPFDAPPIEAPSAVCGKRKRVPFGREAMQREPMEPEAMKPEIDGARNDEARNDGARNDGARNDGARNDGARNDGARNDGARNRWSASLSGERPWTERSPRNARTGFMLTESTEPYRMIVSVFSPWIRSRSVLSVVNAFCHSGATPTSALLLLEREPFRLRAELR